METAYWVKQTFYRLQLQPPTSFNSNHENIYLSLRQEIHQHFQAGNINPQLSLLSKPVGAYQWKPDMMQVERAGAFEDLIQLLLHANENEEGRPLTMDEIEMVDEI